MSDISTFARWKDWLLLALIALVFTLLGSIAGDNRSRIMDIEVELSRNREMRQQLFERLRALEVTPHFDNTDARAIEERLQRQIDSLERRLDDLRRIKNAHASLKK